MYKKLTLLLFSCFCLNGLTAFAQVGDGTDDANFAAYSVFDFTPGQKVIFFDDFSQGLKNWKVVEFDASDEVESPGIKTLPGTEGPWFKLPRKGLAFPTASGTLPDQFTVEFDLWADTDQMSEMEGGLALVIGANLGNREEYSIFFDENPQVQLDVHPSAELLYCIATKGNTSDDRVLDQKQLKNGWAIGEVHRISISRNQSQIRLYVNEKRFIDLPNGLPEKGDYSLLLSTNLWGDGLYVSNFRIAEGIQPPSDLEKEGKFVTNAIYFPFNSATIKPESWAALSQAAEVIKAAKGNVQITGHTDGDGSEESNLALSKKRAESVKQTLVKHFGIPESKLQTDGLGESQPIDSNETPEGKANNRRVEFVRIN